MRGRGCGGQFSSRLFDKSTVHLFYQSATTRWVAVDHNAG